MDMMLFQFYYHMGSKMNFSACEIRPKSGMPLKRISVRQKRKQISFKQWFDRGTLTKKEENNL